MSESAYDDDRPGMMRVHIAEQRGRDLEAKYTRQHLRGIARDLGLSYGNLTKRDLATRLAYLGVNATPSEPTP